MNWIFFPKTNPPPKELLEVVKVFEKVFNQIDSTKNDTNELRLSSDEVLHILEPGLKEVGFKVEKSKKAIDKVRIPVLFGDQGNEQLAFENTGKRVNLDELVEEDYLPLAKQLKNDGKSIRAIAKELNDKGHDVSKSTLQRKLY